MKVHPLSPYGRQNALLMPNISFGGSVRLNFFEVDRMTLQRLLMTKHSPFRYFKTSPEVIRLAVISNQ
jgi:hypothetical protein